MVPIDLELKIGEGGYREVFQTDDETCAKFLRRTREKNYGPFSIAFPMRPYTLLKFGTSDFNELELQNYNYLMSRVPESSHQYFARINGLETIDGQSVSICQLIRDSDGSISKSLKKFGPVDSVEFWDSIEHLRKIILDLGIPYFGVNADNIVVRQEESRVKPVFVDYKRVGMRTYPFQPWVCMRGKKAKKINRLFGRLDKYRNPSEAINGFK
jgi:hypothetical protein